MFDNENLSRCAIETENSVNVIFDSFFPVNLVIKFINDKFYNNTCYEENGGALTISISNELIIKNCIFKSNKAYNNGCALSLHLIRKVKIISCIFYKNTANFISSLSINDLKQEGFGDAIYIKSS